MTIPDAAQRVYMQWEHRISSLPLLWHRTLVQLPTIRPSVPFPLKYRIDVAMSGRLGMEIQPKNMTDEEKDLCRKAIADYKKIRPIVQLGDIYRLISPYDRLGVASLMYTSPEKE